MGVQGSKRYKRQMLPGFHMTQAQPWHGIISTTCYWLKRAPGPAWIQEEGTHYTRLWMLGGVGHWGQFLYTFPELWLITPPPHSPLLMSLAPQSASLLGFLILRSSTTIQSPNTEPRHFPEIFLFFPYTSPHSVTKKACVSHILNMPTLPQPIVMAFL